MSDKWKGAFFGLLMAFFYATMAAFVKMASDVPNESLVFFRNMISFLMLLPIFFLQKIPLTINKLRFHLIRSLCAVVALYLYFYGIKKIDLIDAILLRNTLPLFVPLVLLVWQKEKIPKRRYFGLCLGFLGVFIILRPTFQNLHIGMLACLVSAMFGSFSLVSVRQLVKSHRAQVVVFYFFLFMSFLSFIPFVVHFQSFDPKLFFYIIFVALCSLFYQLALTKTYHFLPASKGACFIYFSVVFGGAYGWFFWGSVPDFATIFGAALTIVGSIWILLER